VSRIEAVPIFEEKDETRTQEGIRMEEKSLFRISENRERGCFEVMFTIELSGIELPASWQRVGAVPSWVIDSKGELRGKRFFSEK
jgi:hypothetical protein